MGLSDDLRKRVVETVVAGGLSRNAAAKSPSRANYVAACGYEPP
ncbi:hypothetical protein MJC1_03522 [Methylocystis sp. MJC1]|nr:hypothetical protein MJC1_03522 [Methylocystis sp. MJC1]